MKAAFLCEFATIRSAFVQMVVLYLIIGVVVGVAIESLVALTACIGAMTPFLIMFTLAGYDATNGWERFRACLPVSRGAIVASRYATILLATVVMLAVAVLLAIALGALAPYLPLPEGTAESFAAENDPFVLLAAGVSGSCIILFVAALLLPPTLRFGMNLAMRIIPAVMVVAVLLIAMSLSQLSDIVAFADIMRFANDPANIPLIVGGAVVVTLAVYAASCAVAAKLYRNKEL